MAFTTIAYKVDADVVKTEGPNRYSRDDVVLVSGSGAIEVGQVLGKVTATGKLKPFTTGASDGSEAPIAVSLQKTDAVAADKTIVILARHAEVVLQALVWPVGITGPQKIAALAALETRGIVARMGV